MHKTIDNCWVQHELESMRESWEVCRWDHADDTHSNAIVSMLWRFGVSMCRCTTKWIKCVRHHMCVKRPPALPFDKILIFFIMLMPSVNNAGAILNICVRKREKVNKRHTQYVILHRFGIFQCLKLCLANKMLCNVLWNE